MVKTNPIQTQSNPIAERVKLMQSVYLQRIMKKNAAKGYKKTKPKQTQFPQRAKLMQSLYLQRIMKINADMGSEKQIQITQMKMFKTLSGLIDNAFWRVSADTKTCGSPLYLPSLWRFVLYQISDKSQEEKCFIST